ncbi:MAG TPA: hypothetical protein VGA51_13725 [Casimicrobiaceae bacterium]
MAYAKLVPDRWLGQRERPGGAESAADARNKAYITLKKTDRSDEMRRKWRAMSRD